MGRGGSPSELFVCLARMHHIRSKSKFKKVMRSAENHDICGFVKKGRPGVLLVDGTRTAIHAFLSDIRGLRYLDFHHVDTRPTPIQDYTRLQGGEPGLREVPEMRNLVDAADGLGEGWKTWFRTMMGMARGK